MGLPLHTVEMVNGSAPTSQSDRLKSALMFAVPNAAGSGAGASVTVAISGLDLPANYVVDVEVDQDATAYVTSKTQAGFDVVLSPRLAANTLAAGSFNLTIFG